MRTSLSSLLGLLVAACTTMNPGAGLSAVESAGTSEHGADERTGRDRDDPDYLASGPPIGETPVMAPRVEVQTSAPELLGITERGVRYVTRVAITNTGREPAEAPLAVVRTEATRGHERVACAVEEVRVGTAAALAPGERRVVEAVALCPHSDEDHIVRSFVTLPGVSGDVPWYSGSTPVTIAAR